MPPTRVQHDPLHPGPCPASKCSQWHAPGGGGVGGSGGGGGTGDGGGDGGGAGGGGGG